MEDIHAILKRYWGFDDFRPLQEDIIRSVLSGRDTIALLPTGGGKSICYQVPGLAQEGVTIVISPLIALMKDQVEGLQEKGVNARALSSGMGWSEIDRVLDKAVHGKLDFLYVSPERTLTELFRERFRRMRIALIAVDEAHCISQWGYDFRPSYLRIAEVRQYQPFIPVLALTATATPKVLEDIRDKLGGEDPAVFRKSFERKNLAYVVRRAEDKQGSLLRILQKVPGTSVVYVRSRKRTEQVAELLKKKGVSAAAYHAGLDKRKRESLQKDWIGDRIRVMVATNAFGMGIDKPDVRSVVHLDLPDSPEAYFQEAGRGGRDGKKSYAVLLVHENDEREMERRSERDFPPFSLVQQVYEALCQKLRVAYGAGSNETYAVDLEALAEESGLKRVEVHNALKILEWEGKLSVTLDLEEPPMLRSKMTPSALYDFQVRHPGSAGPIELLLRSYGGIFEDQVPIDERKLAKRAGMSVKDLDKALRKLAKQDVIEYQPREGRPRVTFLWPRVEKERVQPSKEGYHARRSATVERRNAMVRYAREDDECRSRYLLAYFGEENAPPCGVCDVCIDRKKKGLGQAEFEHLDERVRRILQEKPRDIRGLQEVLEHVDREHLLEVVRWNLDHGYLKQDEDRRLKSTQKAPK